MGFVISSSIIKRVISSFYLFFLYYVVWDFWIGLIYVFFCVQMMCARKLNVGKEHAKLLRIVLFLLNVSVIMVGRKLLIPMMMVA